jgi:hypothetical protein
MSSTSEVTVTQSARSPESLEAEIAQLYEALASRATIEQAKGIVMAAHRLSPEQAWQLMAKVSQDRNVKLRQLAQATVDLVYGADPVDPRATAIAVRFLLGRGRPRAARP